MVKIIQLPDLNSSKTERTIGEWQQEQMTEAEKLAFWISFFELVLKEEN